MRTRQTANPRTTETDSEYPPQSSTLLLLGLALSSSYLGWSLAAQQLAVRRAESALIASGHGHAALLVSPAPFTTLMWRAVAVDEDGDGEAWISLRPGAPAPQWRWQPQSTALREAAGQ